MREGPSLTLMPVLPFTVLWFTKLFYMLFLFPVSVSSYLPAYLSVFPFFPQEAVRCSENYGL